MTTTGNDGDEDALPFIDEHGLEIDAAPERVWAALLSVLPKSFDGKPAEAFAALVGVDDRRARGDLGEPGSTLVGFHVARADAPRELALVGRHHFSRYALTWAIDDLGGGRSKLRAGTRAEFPGLHGRAYRALVIGTTFHARLLRRLLAATARRAERA